jgi:hypothetical protein
MATTITTDVHDNRPSGLYERIVSESAIVLSQKISTVAPSSSLSVYTVPAGRALFVDRIFCGNSNNTSDDDVGIYDDGDDVPRDRHLKGTITFPDWKTSMGTYNYSPPLIFTNGICFKDSDLDPNVHKLLVVCGRLVKW